MSDKNINSCNNHRIVFAYARLALLIFGNMLISSSLSVVFGQPAASTTQSTKNSNISYAETSNEIFIFHHKIKISDKCNTQTARVIGGKIGEYEGHIDKTILLKDLHDQQSQASKLLEKSRIISFGIEISCLDPFVNRKNIELLRYGVIGLAFFSEPVSSDNFCHREDSLLHVCSHLKKFAQSGSPFSEQFFYDSPFHYTYVDTDKSLASAIDLPLFFVCDHEFQSCTDSAVYPGVGDYDSPGFFLYDDVAFGATFQSSRFKGENTHKPEIMDENWVAIHNTIVASLIKSIAKKER